MLCSSIKSLSKVVHPEASSLECTKSRYYIGKNCDDREHSCSVLTLHMLTAVCRWQHHRQPQSVIPTSPCLRAH
eukprot:4931283-Amphidinium_carterae.1